MVIQIIKKVRDSTVILKDNNWLTDSELANGYINALCKDIKEQMQSLIKINKNQPIAGYIEYRIEYRNGVARRRLCLHRNKIGWLCRQNEKFNEYKEIANPQKDEDWLSAEDLTNLYIAASQEKIQKRLKEIHDNVYSMTYHKYIKYCTHGKNITLCLAKDKIGWFCRKSGLKLQNKTKNILCTNSIIEYTNKYNLGR
ncbi:MAG: hypothetical protein MJ187_03450 [Alphaproteobacteria bacterium]|nr:hypothetical protein [Alphaproteobacteria bacterium]